ncbi:WD repeat-containing protein DDB_G0349043 [Cyclospora cayetanensis]|uniref:WD repeat-containing protein DDB_G0349043 n=1 Tax=Cyclospora cayetanensis TaxID=88456 RepID=A0A6P6RU86_9EIME|nr:WD repeat-containing protein DDB_G0349043 [Cyclospora cayetanensis]
MDPFDTASDSWGASRPQPLPLTGMHVSGTKEGETSNKWRGFDKKEVLRLILQTLDEMGYRDIVASLEKTSGVELLPLDMRNLQRHVLDGNWVDAGRSLLSLPIEQLTRQGCWFLLMQHKYLELVIDPYSSLEAKMQCLRRDLRPSAFDAATIERVHECASLLMYQGSDLLGHVLQISSLSRNQLFSRLTCLLPSVVAMQPSRLATILAHARRFQILCCPLHDESQCSAKDTILEPHRCEIPLFPECCVGRLHAHRKAVWTISVAPRQASTNEVLVASGSSDRSVCVWQVSTDTSIWESTFSGQSRATDHFDRGQLGAKWLSTWLNGDNDVLMRLEQTHPRPLLEKGQIIGTCRLLWRLQRLASPAAFLDWDTTGTLLAAGGESAFIEAWEEGRRIGDYCTHGGSLVALQWVPGSKRLISMASDRTMTLVLLQASTLAVTHLVEYEWILPARPQEGFLLPHRESVMVFFADRQAKVYDLVTKEETFWVHGKDLVVAACPSKFCNQILISTANTPPVLQLWDMDERKTVQNYRGHKLGRLTIRPAFGGHSEEFVISGSEDAQIYIWHRVWGCMMQQLRGHAAAVNQVAWVHSCNPVCLLSAGDDGAILLWSSITDYSHGGSGGSYEETSPDGVTVSSSGRETPDTHGPPYS